MLWVIFFERKQTLMGSCTGPRKTCTAVWSGSHSPMQPVSSHLNRDSWPIHRGPLLSTEPPLISFTPVITLIEWDREWLSFTVDLFFWRGLGLLRYSLYYNDFTFWESACIWWTDRKDSLPDCKSCTKRQYQRTPASGGEPLLWLSDVRGSFHVTPH